MARHRQSGWSTFALFVLATALAVPFLNPQTVLAQDVGTIDTVAGTGGVPGYSGDGGPATDALLKEPCGITLDDSGNLFFADWGNHRVRMVPATSGTFFGQSMTAGYVYSIAGTGTAGYSGDDGTGTDAQLNMPQGVAVDGMGGVFIADTNNHRIRYLRSDGTIISRGGTGAASFSGDGGPCSSAALNTPTGVAVDGTGNMYIADKGNNRIRMIPGLDGTYYGQTMTLGYIYTIAGTGTGSYSGDSGSPTAATLYEPYSPYVDDAGNLYIADTHNHRVRMIPATTDTHFGVSMTAGNIYTVAGMGSPGFSGDGGPAVSAELSWPSNMVVNSEGHMFVADRINRRVRAVDSDGVISTFAGTGDGGFSGDGGPATEATLGNVYGVTVDRRGDVYVTDTDNDCIREVFGELAPWMTFLGGAGYDTGNSIAVDGEGNVYVTGHCNAAWAESPVLPYQGGDGDAFVAKLNPTGGLVWHTFLGNSTTDASDAGYGIAVDTAGNVYVAGFSGVGAWDAAAGDPLRLHSDSNDAFVARLEAEDGDLTWYTFLGGSGSDSGSGIAVDNVGNIYVTGTSYADWGLTGDDAPKRAFESSGDAFAAKLGTDGSLTWHTFLGGSGGDSGCGIAVDGSGNAFVAGWSGSAWTEMAVRGFSDNIDAFAAKLDSDGARSWHTFLGSSGEDCIDYRCGIAVDGDGNVYVASSSRASWGTSPLRAHSGGGSDGFAARLDSDDGSLTWNTFLGGSGGDLGGPIASGDDGNVYLAGYSDATWGEPEQAYAAGNDCFAAKLGANGSLLWNTFAGCDDPTGADVCYAVALDDNGKVAITGSSSDDWGDPVRDWVGTYQDALVVQLQSPESTTVDLELDLKAGWNMVSVPVVPADTSRATVFPPADVVAVYTWNPVTKSYEVPTSIAPEVGYWVAVTGDKTITVTGTPKTTWTSGLTAGWNMIGSVYGPAVSVNDADAFTVAPPGSVLTSAIYWWNPVSKSYETATSIVEGQGYWAATTVGCTLTMTAPV